MSTKPDIYADNPVIDHEYIIAFLMAWKKGAQVQYRYHNYTGSSWQDIITVPSPRHTWNWDKYDYRINPNCQTKKILPMQVDDYPSLFWVREKKFPNQISLCTGMTHGFLFFHFRLPSIGTNTTIYVLAGIDVADPRPCEYSIDRKTWLPCTKEVAE